MYTKIIGEQQVQILSPNFSISPSNEDYVLNISANGRDFSPLFAVSAGVTRLVSNVAPGSYYKLVGNRSEVVINWQRMCATDGGSFDPTVLDPYWTSAQTVDYVDGVVASGINLDAYWTSAETQSALTAVEDHLFDVEEVTASALTELHEGLLEVSARTVDLSGYYTSGETDAAISAATSGKADAAVNPPRYEARIFPKWNAQGIITGVTGGTIIKEELRINDKYANILNENGGAANFPHIYAPTTRGTAGDILVSTGNGAPVWSAVTMGGNSNILAAISSLTEYAAISGSVKNGDLIQVYNVDINGDGDPEYGLFQAEVQEEEDGPGGDIIRFVYWERKDNADSVLWADKIYPWMADNDVWPVDFGEGHFLISTDDTSEDEAYNGIGFDADGKPVITHIVPQYEEGEITGMTREDRDILGELDTLDEVVSQALVDLNERVDEISGATQDMVTSTDVRHIVKLTQAEYDQLATKDPETFYIIINNNK